VKRAQRQKENAKQIETGLTCEDTIQPSKKDGVPDFRRKERDNRKRPAKTDNIIKRDGRGRSSFKQKKANKKEEIICPVCQSIKIDRLFACSYPERNKGHTTLSEQIQFDKMRNSGGTKNV
jgi:hypothetical protein